MELVTDLCFSARNASTNDQIFRIRLVEERFKDVSDVKFQPEYPGTAPTVSLLHLLENGILKDRERFYPNDKKVLAYTLAHALLNLYEGPWLQSLWTLDNIFFPYEANTGKLYNIHQPYVACNLSADTPTLGTLDASHKYPLILSFATLLLELETGEQVQAIRTNKKGEPSVFTTLREYCLRSSKHQLSLRYGNALRACVNFSTCLEKELGQDPSTTVPQVILKYIVQELESEIDLSSRLEWGTRVLDLKSGNTVVSREAEAEVVRGSQQNTSYDLRSSATAVSTNKTRKVLGQTRYGGDTTARPGQDVSRNPRSGTGRLGPSLASETEPTGKTLGVRRTTQSTDGSREMGRIRTPPNRPPSHLGHASIKSSSSRSIIPHKLQRHPIAQEVFSAEPSCHRENFMDPLPMVSPGENPSSYRGQGTDRQLETLGGPQIMRYDNNVIAYAGYLLVTYLMRSLNMSLLMTATL